MGKSVLEFVGAGVAIAGAGICIASAPGLAYAETEGPPSASAPADSESTDNSDTTGDEQSSTDTDTDTESATEATKEEGEEDPAAEEPGEETEPTSDDDLDTVSFPENGTDEETPEAQPLLSPTGNDAGSGDGYSAGPVDTTPPTTKTVDQEEAETTPEPTTSTRQRPSAPEPEAQPATTATPLPSAVPTVAPKEADASVRSAAEAGSAAATPNPVVTVLAGVLTFLGLNTPEPPDNPLGALVWGWFRRIETALGVVPRAGDTTVSAPTAEGVVSGDAGFDDTGLPLTYNASVNPDYGTVVVNPDGTFTFTPTRAARLAAGVAGANLTATITLTATNGLAATNTTLIVPVSPYQQGAVIGTVPVGWFVNTMALSPDGSYLYVTATDVDYETQTTTGTVKVVDTATGTVLTSIPTGSDQPMDIAFTPDGVYAYATMPNKTVLVINRGHAVFAAISTNEAPNDVAITPDGKYAYVPNSGYPFGYVAVIDTATQTKIGEIPIATGGTDIAIADTPNGTLAYITENRADGTFAVKVIDTSVNIVVDTIGPLDIPAGSILASPDSARVYISTNSADGVVYVIDTATNAVENTIHVGDWISSPVLSPDGAYLYVVSGGKILVIDTFTNSFVGEPISTVDEPLTLAVSTDGNLLYVASSAGDTLSVVYTGNQVDEKDV